MNVLAKVPPPRPRARRWTATPGLSGKELCAYVASGIASDHECSTAQEALDKLRLGQWIMIREGTAAQNLQALLLAEGALCPPLPVRHRR